MSDSLPKIDEIFLTAIEKESIAERDEYLDEACEGNADLRQQVERLLAAHPKAGKFMESPVARMDPTTGDSAIAERPGTVIGSYKLLQELGHGGMGIVFMAEQSEPVKRRVALKIIKPGMDTRQVIARFEAERQALAMMDHPNIAHVLDVGTTNSGRPFFAMELVKGVPITQYCDEHQFSVRQRLELFADVCHAVQHAHQKGIIHRDIKPSNVLVAEYDDRAVPKIIDFGLAKAIQQRLTEKTMFTHMGQVVGTLEYMSPEQAKLNQLDIDTRSDIYSLGVLLYELLTGETPFDRQRLRSAAFDEILRILREEEPPRPSLRVGTSESLPSIAANRHVEPKRLSVLVRGELDWIVMKAMEKDRARRYDTANAFALDITNYLNDDAVKACPPSATYRFKKFARRNKAAILVVGVVTSTLVCGVFGTTWQAIRATNAQRRAVVAASDASAQAQRARASERDALEASGRADSEARKAKSSEAEAVAQARRARNSLQKAQEAIDQMLTRIGDERLKHVPHAERLRQEFLQDALRLYEDLLKTEQDSVDLRTEAAHANARVGRINLLLGRRRDAQRAFRNSVDAYEALSSHPHFSKLQSDYIRAKIDLACVSSSEPALSLFQDSLASTNHLLEENPTNLVAIALQARIYTCMGNLHFHNGRHERAIADWKRAIDIAEPQVAAHADSFFDTLSNAYNRYGYRLQAVDELKVAENLYRRAADMTESLLKDHPNELTYQLSLIPTYHNLNYVLNRQGRFVEAETYNNRRIAIVTQLAADFPHVPSYRASLALGYHQAGRKLPLDDPENLASRQRSIAIAQELMENSDTGDFRRYYARALMNLARYAWFQQEWAEAETLLRRVVDLRGKRTNNVSEFRELSWEIPTLGKALYKQGKSDDAAAFLRDEISLRETILADHADEVFVRVGLASCYASLGDILLDQGAYVDAEEHYVKAVGAYQRLIDQFGPEVRRVQVLQVGCCAALMKTCTLDNRSDQADQWRARATETIREAFQRWRAALNAENGRASYLLVQLNGLRPDGQIVDRTEPAQLNNLADTAVRLRSLREDMRRFISMPEEVEALQSLWKEHAELTQVAHGLAFADVAEASGLEVAVEHVQRLVKMYPDCPYSAKQLGIVVRPTETASEDHP